MKATLGKNAFARRMRDWEIVQNQRQECSPGRTMLGFEVAAPQAREVANRLTLWTAVSVRNRWAPVIRAVHVHDKA